MSKTQRVRTFVVGMALAAAIATAYAGVLSHTPQPFFALAVLGLAATTARMKVKLPGIDGNMSMNLPFLLLAIAKLSAAEAIAIAGLSTVVQCWPRRTSKWNPEQMTFNISMMAFAASIASLVFHQRWLVGGGWAAVPVGSVLSSGMFFIGQPAPVALIVALSEGKPAASTWWRLAQLSFPYYVLSAGITAMVQAVGGHTNWGLGLAIFPVMYGIHRSYHLYFTAMSQTQSPRLMAKAAGA